MNPSPEIVAALISALSLALSVGVNALIARRAQNTKGKAEEADAAESLSKAADTLVKHYRDETAVYRAEVIDLRKTVADYEERDGQTQAELKAVRGAVTELNQSLAIAETERQRAQERSKKRDQEIAHLQAQIGMLTVALHNVTVERDELRTRVGMLEKKLKELSSKTSEILDQNSSS